MPKPQVIIDCFPESARKYSQGCTIVAIDVIRATTSAITAVASGRRCLTVPSLEALQEQILSLDNPLLVGELGGEMPVGFDMNNSPVELLARDDTYRPAVLLSTSGTRLIHEARQADHTLLSCFRNWEATAAFLIAGTPERVALIGAGSRREFREEDQMCCAWLADALLNAGFAAGDSGTKLLAKLWRGAQADACRVSNSAKYLRSTNQEKDLEFVIDHVNDLNLAFFASSDGEVFAHPTASIDEKSIGPFAVAGEAPIAAV